MSIATVVTRGYGSFGSVNKLPTRGYSAAAVSDILSADSAVFIGFRDKRQVVLFRDKRHAIAFRDKRAIEKGR